MADTRTPKTSTILHGWLRGHPFPLTTDPEEREAEFWRWLAAHDRETAARAWDEGERHEAHTLTTLGQFCPHGTRCNPYREETP